MGSIDAALDRPQIWWVNAIFFISVHIASALGVYWFPPQLVAKQSLLLAFLSWQLADFGVTIGYHRLYSHRAFRASFGVRVILAGLGATAFQGSIKWWCLRHRLHHRFTDDPIHDPYAATRGLFYSHMGWIFFKPTYEKMELVDRADLDSDPVVRFQHKHYVPLALFFGFLLPPTFGYFGWGDPVGSFVWGSLVSRLFIWHSTFCVNSLAHWDGLQPYSDEDTSRGNLLLALLTGGEGNHNFHHAFPHDFRSGPTLTDWDPSKWIILLLHRLGLVTGLRRARSDDMTEASAYMKYKTTHGSPPISVEPDVKELWNLAQVHEYINERPGRCVILLHGFVVDATPYLGDHPGGAVLLRKYAFNKKEMSFWQDASWAFDGGLNNHSRAAKRRMGELVIAKLHT
ncbi:hypothetical protein C8J56DRAFT_920193 [Mycena floridula]|nr:hypothetical protein C8J56DRAFT_920193 [Mycena floridula]